MLDRKQRVAAGLCLLCAALSLIFLADTPYTVTLGLVVGLGLVGLALTGRWGAELQTRRAADREVAIETVVALASLSLILFLSLLAPSYERNLIIGMIAILAAVATALRALAINRTWGLYQQQILRTVLFLAETAVLMRLIDVDLDRPTVALCVALSVLLAHMTLGPSVQLVAIRLVAVCAVCLRLVGVDDRDAHLALMATVGIALDLDWSARFVRTEANSLPQRRIPVWLVAALAGVIAAALVNWPMLPQFLMFGAGALLLLGAAGYARMTMDFGSRLRTAEQDLSALRAVAELDDLTGLPLRGALRRRLEEEVERAIRYRQPMCVCFIDIDYFKDINDRYGHAAGDLVLARVGETIRTTLRTPDFVARYGGEEFVVIAPATWSEDARVLGARLQAALSAASYGDLDVELTVSIGVAGVPEHATTADVVLHRADLALYRAKFAGRNRIEIAADGEEL